MPESTEAVLAAMGLSAGALAGEIAVVTGAGRGIGREVALALAHLGARVVAADVSSDGTETARRIEAAGGLVLAVPTDVANEQDVARLARACAERFGPATLLVNGAIMSPLAAVLETDLATWERVLAVNLRGPFLTARAFLPAMLAAGRGTIVNLVSTEGMAFMAAYSAAKQGLAGFSRSLAAEVGPRGVRVIAFASGVVDTPGLREAVATLTSRLGMTMEQLVGPVTPAAEAAAAMAYLVTHLAEQYHGETVDGYAVLERSGYRRPPVEPHLPPHEAAAPRTEGRLAAAAVALQQSHRLRAILTETEGEFERLPLLARRFARRSLHQKTGLAIEDWRRLVSDVEGHLEQVNTLGATAVAALRSEHHQLEETLRALERYYREAPAEFDQFTRDEQALAESLRIAEGGQATIDDLCRALHEVMA